MFYPSHASSQSILCYALLYSALISFTLLSRLDLPLLFPMVYLLLCHTLYSSAPLLPSQRLSFLLHGDRRNHLHGPSVGNKSGSVGREGSYNGSIEATEKDTPTFFSITLACTVNDPSIACRFRLDASL
jgi:hypothetical protein